MDYRVMQIFIPQGDDDRLNELLEGREILGRWQDTDGGPIALNLLVLAEDTESIMDRFEQQYSKVKGFHVVLLSVDAVLPRPEPEDDEVNELVPSNGEDEKKTQQRISREELYTKVSEGLSVSRVFVGMTMLSALVAAGGLLRDDVAVIIGAMVIAPLLGPNVAMSLGTTLGDFALIRRAVVINVIGVATAFFCAVAIGLIFTVSPDIPAIDSRTKVELGHILLALAAGSAGTLAFTLGRSGAVIGVMVAVALVPPLVVCGMLVGASHFKLALGAFSLTVANIICINLAGVATFIVQGVRPRTWWEAKRARKATWQATLVWIVLLAILGGVVWLNQNRLVD